MNDPEERVGIADALEAAQGTRWRHDDPDRDDEPDRSQLGPLDRPGLFEVQGRVDRAELMDRIDAEIAQERAERDNPDTARLVEARDHQAAGGRFADADSTQRLIDSIRFNEGPAVTERTLAEAQGYTFARADVYLNRDPGRPRDYPPMTRGRDR